MKKRFFSMILALTMVLSLMPGMALTASAEETWESSEEIIFYSDTHAISDHFTLAANGANSIDGWFAGLVSDIQSKIVINAKSDDIVITHIDAVVSAGGGNYQSAEYSSGEKAETGSVEDNTTVHVRNIDANQLTITCPDSSIAFKAVTVYYTYVRTENITEEIVFNGYTSAKSDHFTLRANGANTINGWFAGLVSDIQSKIVIKATSDDIVITHINAIIGAGGNNYRSVEYSTGEKVETDSVEDNTTVHVRNIDANQLTITCSDSSIAFKTITVTYRIDSPALPRHHFVGAVKDNGNGTHSFKCITCDQYGEALDHTWQEATCLRPKTCSVCGATEGEIGPHLWTAPISCAEPGFCLNCHAPGESLPHTLTEATCTRPSLCLECRQYIGEPLGHDFPETWERYNAEQHMRTCERCKEIEYADHAWKDYICTACGEENVAGARADAVDEIIKATTGANYAITQKAFYDIGAAGTVADVIEIKNQALADMAEAEAEAELAAAKKAAKEAIAAEQGSDNSQNVVKAAEDAIAAIEAATTVDEVNAAKDEGIEAIRNAKNVNPRPIPETYYTLTFEVNDGSAISVPGVSGKVIDLSKYVPVKEGYAFEGWYSDKALTAPVTEIKLTGDKTVYAKWIENTPVARVLPFTDVAPSAWSYDDIYYVWEKGLMNGVSDTIFDPAGITTRGQVVAILYRLDGEPAMMNANIFEDVAVGSYYEKAIVWAQGKGIIGGYDNGKFGPDDPITREQMAAILYRYAKFKGIDAGIGENSNFLSYNDFWNVSGYAMPAMMWAIQNKLIQGDNWNLMPQGNATREQTAAILHRFCEEIMK